MECKVFQLLSTLGFTTLSHDPCLFTNGFADDFVTLLVYVDDVIFIGASLSLISDFKSSIYSTFTIKDLGPAKFFIGM